MRFGGRVQGVGFRATTSQIARDYPVTGWVQNEPDGSVLLEVQGAAPEIARMLSDLTQGFTRNIQTTDSSAIALVEGECGFRIRR